MFAGFEYSSLSDAELAQQIIGARPGAAQGEEAELFRRFARPVRLYGLRHLKDGHSTADLVQIVLTRTIEKLRTRRVREPEKIASFVLGVARMTVREIQRGGNRELPREPQRLAEESRAFSPTYERLRAEPFSRRQLAACLETLSERDRAVVLLTYFDEQDTAQIAETLELERGNVRVIRHRAIARLRDCMEVSREAVA